MSGWEKSAGCWGCSPRAPLGPRGTPSPEMSPRYLGGENKRTGEAAARAVYLPLPHLFKILGRFTNIHLVATYKAASYARHHTLCPRQPGCPVRTSVSPMAASCPPYLYLGLRGRASLPDVHRKQGWGWAGQGGEENGGLRREAVQDRRSSLLFLSGAPNTRFRICRKGSWNGP